MKPKVFHLIKSLGRGGAETLLVETLSSSSRDKFDFVYGYFLPWKDQLVKSLQDQGVRVECFHATNNIFLLLKWRKVLRFIREENISIIHCHLPWAGFLGRILGKITGLPVIYTEHNKLERYHILTRTLNIMSLSWNAAVVAVSDEVRQSIIGFKGDAFPVTTIANGINVEKYTRNEAERTTSREGLGLSASHIVIGNVCVFRVQKRLLQWLEIAANLVKHNKDIRFLLVGDGPLKSAVAEQITRSGLDNYVILPGLKENVKPYLAAMDIFMLTSEFEGLPLALLEAMAMEIPVAVTNAGGVDSVVSDEVNGLKVDVSRVMDLEQSVGRLLNDRELRQTLGARGRATIVNEFSIERMVRATEKLYEKYLS